MQKEQKTYTKEFKIEAVHLLESSQKSQAQIARELGVADSTLSQWRKDLTDHGHDAFPGSGHQTPREEENRHVKREGEVLRQEREILKKAISIFSRGQGCAYQFIADHRDEYPVERMCQVLEVSVSGYYAWRKRPVSHHQREDARLAAEIQTIFLENRGCVWESTYSRGLARMRDTLWTQAGGAADANAGAASQAASKAETHHNQE